MELITLKGIKLRIYPSKEQQTSIKLNFGYNRFVWNQMLGMLQERYKNNPKLPIPSAFTLDRLLPMMKLEYPWLKEAESHSLRITCKNLVDAYKAFFKTHKGLPKFKSKKYPKQSYQTDNPSEVVQLEAVKQDGSAVQFIDNPSEAVQVEAVKQDYYAIWNIYNPSELVQLEAVKQNGWAIQYIKNPSEQVKLEAVKQDGWAIRFIDNPSEAVQLEAVKENGKDIRYIDNPSEKVRKLAKEEH